MDTLLNKIKAIKAIKKSDENLVAKLESLGVTVTETESAKRHNPFTGVSVLLTPEACAMFDFITGSYKNYMATRGQFSYKSNKFPVSIWDRSRYLFLELWPNAYYDLID